MQRTCGSSRPRLPSPRQGAASSASPELRKSFRDEGRTTGWLSAERLIWEGWIDEANVPDPSNPAMVFRLDLYLGERDSHGIGFSPPFTRSTHDRPVDEPAAVVAP